jgi:hypothetical protein
LQERRERELVIHHQTLHRVLLVAWPGMVAKFAAVV